MVLLYLLFLSSVVSATYIREGTPPCGILESLREPRIVGGRDSFKGEIPWIVSIQSDNEHFCGGTIIGKKYILSAAHCFDSPSMDESIHRLTVALGAHNLSNIDQSKTKIIGIKRIIRHNDYTADGHYLNDISILELKEDIKWSPYIKPICLPESEVPRGIWATASGWGQTWGRRRFRDNELNFKNDKAQHYSRYSIVLKAVNLTIFDNSFCDSIYLEYSTLSILKTQMCAGVLVDDANQRDTAKGDSGGPLAVVVANRWTIAGITSSAPKFKAPGIYSNVHSFMKWIRENTQD